MIAPIDYSSLNHAQREAVFCGHPRILCLAGAGTGKTHVLTHRIAQLWESGASPENMLALTFTRAAGAEMKSRVIGLIGSGGKKLFCNTFHAFCADVVRRNAETLGYRPDFAVYGQADADRLANEVLADLGIKAAEKKFAAVRAGKPHGGVTLAEGMNIGRALAEYRFRLKRNNALDFDGLIETVRHAAGQNPDIYTQLGERYSHVFVDEFQDTDAGQWGIIKGMRPENLFVVGDDFQSIYGFRGSDVGIIMGLADNPGWHVVKLEENYRSSAPIVEAANRLIRHNRQTKKILRTDKPGAEVEFRRPADGGQEIPEIFWRLERNVQAGRTTAILARTNRQVDAARAALKGRGIPYETPAPSESPLAGAEAKLLLSVIAAIANPRDEAALRDIAAARIGKAAALEAEMLQLETSMPLEEALAATEEGGRFLWHFNELKTMLDACGAGWDAGWDAGWGAEGMDGGRGAEGMDGGRGAEGMDGGGITGMASVIMSFYGLGCTNALDAIEKWRQRQAGLGEPAGAAALAEWARTCNVAEQAASERDPGKVYLSTVHGSKGLEFDEVYIIGAVQGVFPGKGDAGEERRLFYVAMTRARELLNISSPYALAEFSGYMKEHECSQFVAEALPAQAAVCGQWAQ